MDSNATKENPAATPVLCFGEKPNRNDAIRLLIRATRRRGTTRAPSSSG